MGYPRQPTSQAQLDATVRRLRYLTLSERLESEETPWPSGDPLYLGLRREAAAAIRELIGPAPETPSVPYDTAANFAKSCTVVPKGHFWRGEPESNRHQCRNCGEHYDNHLHTDEASRCPTANR